jgi:ribonuclease E
MAPARPLAPESATQRLEAAAQPAKQERRGLFSKVINALFSAPEQAPSPVEATPEPARAPAPERERRPRRGEDRDAERASGRRRPPREGRAPAQGRRDAAESRAPDREPAAPRSGEQRQESAQGAGPQGGAQGAGRGRNRRRRSQSAEGRAEGRTEARVEARTEGSDARERQPVEREPGARRPEGRRDPRPAQQPSSAENDVRAQAREAAHPSEPIPEHRLPPDLDQSKRRPRRDRAAIGRARDAAEAAGTPSAPAPAAKRIDRAVAADEPDAVTATGSTDATPSTPEPRAGEPESATSHAGEPQRSSEHDVPAAVTAIDSDESTDVEEWGDRPQPAGTYLPADADAGDAVAAGEPESAISQPDAPSAQTHTAARSGLANIVIEQPQLKPAAPPQLPKGRAANDPREVRRRQREAQLREQG